MIGRLLFLVTKIKHQDDGDYRRIGANGKAHEKRQQKAGTNKGITLRNNRGQASTSL
jgi:hypothetical protein